MPLQRKATCGDALESKYRVNVYLLATKAIVFTGTTKQVAEYVGAKRPSQILPYINKKQRYKKTYCFRVTK